MELHQGITNAFVGVFTLSDYWTEILLLDDSLEFEGKTIDNDEPDWKWVAKKRNVSEEEAEKYIRDKVRAKKQKEKKRNAVDFSAAEANSDDGNSDRSVCDDEDSIIVHFATFMACIDYIRLKNGEEDPVSLIEESIQLPATLTTQFADFLQTGGDVTEGELFLNYVLSHHHNRGRIKPTAPLFHYKGVEHTIKDLFSALELGTENRKFFMSRFLEPLKSWSASNSAATLSTLYPDLQAEDSDDNNDGFFNNAPIKPCGYDAPITFGDRQNNKSFDDMEAVPDDAILGDYGDFCFDSGDEEAFKPKFKAMEPNEKAKASKLKEGGTKLAITLQNSFSADISTIGCSGTAISNTKANTFLRVDEGKKAEEIAETPEARTSQLFRHACSPTAASVQAQSPAKASSQKPDEWVVKFNKCLTTEKDVFFYLKRGQFILHSISFVFRFMLICFCVYFPPFF